MKIDLGITLPDLRQKLHVILTNACRECSVPIYQVYGKKRDDKLVQARVLYVREARRLRPDKTLKEIGAVIKRDHSTVLHYLNNYKSPLILGRVAL